MKIHNALLRTVLFFLIFLSGCVNSNSPTITADPVNWNSTNSIYNAVDGKKEYSMIFFYTDWCSYCHRMDEFTFSNPTVSNIMNQYFNNVRINAESDTLVVHFDSTLTGREMKSFYNVGAYPTTCILKGDGQYIYTVVGYTNANDFAEGLNRVLNGIYD